MEGYFVESGEHLGVGVDAIDREIGIDQHIANDHPIAIEVSQLQGDGVVVSQEDLAVGCFA